MSKKSEKVSKPLPKFEFVCTPAGFNFDPLNLPKTPIPALVKLTRGVVEWLLASGGYPELYRHNRTLDVTRRLEAKEDFLHGRYLLVPDFIGISNGKAYINKNGTTLVPEGEFFVTNAQTRLSGLLDAYDVNPNLEPPLMGILFGLEPESQEVTDKGRGRSLTAQIELQRPEMPKRVKAPVAKCAQILSVNWAYPMRGLDTLEAHYKHYEPDLKVIMDIMSRANREAKLNIAPLLGALTIAHRKNEEKVEHFAKQLVYLSDFRNPDAPKQKEVTAEDPAYKLYDYVTSGTRTRGHTGSDLVYRALRSLMAAVTGDRFQNYTVPQMENAIEFFRANWQLEEIARIINPFTAIKYQFPLSKKAA